MIRVKFIEVGRGNKTWEADCPNEITYQWLYNQVKSRGGVMSSNLFFSDSGTIFAGFHPIGKFEIASETSTGEGGGAA